MLKDADNSNVNNEIIIHTIETFEEKLRNLFSWINNQLDIAGGDIIFTTINKSDKGRMSPTLSKTTREQSYLMLNDWLKKFGLSSIKQGIIQQKPILSFVLGLQ